MCYTVPMKVLVACEFSGVVRDAFLAKGHDAISCDLLPTESPGPHIQGDVRPLLQEPWDLVVAFPPCDRLTMLNHIFHLPEKMLNWEAEYEVALDLFHQCLDANAAGVAVENPLPHPRARASMGEFDFLTCPSHFGAPYTKRTAFWLRNVAPLMATMVNPNTRPLVKFGRWAWTDNRRGRKEGLTSNKKASSRFFPGMATAMAEQWGNYHA